MTDFDTLVAAARAQIPGYSPEWTDHNPSDPGIALIELAASFVEMLLFQAEQVTDQTRLAFLRLLEGPARKLAEGEDLEQALDAAVRRIREPFRAVTPADYVELIRTQWPVSAAGRALAARGRVARTCALAERDLTRPQVLRADGHFSVVVVTPEGGAPEAEVLAALGAFLDERRLLTVQTHVVGPTFVKVGVKARVYADDDTDERYLAGRVRDALAGLFAPLTWPFGRPVFASDVLAHIDAVLGVDFVEQLELVTPDATRLLKEGSDTISVRIGAHELAAFDPDLTHLTVYSRAGGTWIPLNP